MRRILPYLLIVLLMPAIAYSQGNKTITIYASPSQGDSIQQAITVLQTELKRAYPAGFAVVPLKASSNGITLATVAQANANKISFPASLKKMGPEAFSISGTAQSIVITGNSAMAVQEAVYAYLEELGYRWLMPGDAWRVVPAITSPYKKMTLVTQPHYEYRWIANGHGYMNSVKIASDFNTWAAANRLGGSFSIRVGHAYDEVVQRNMDAFKQHPEYFAVPPAKGTIPGEFKFNIANKDLVDLVIKDAISRYELQQRIKDPSPMVSMEPSDGGGYCTTCKNAGTPSEQVYSLTNTVAKAFSKKLPGIWVGQFAYNEHILPPKSSMEPNVFIMITDGFNRTQYSTTELMQAWSRKVKKIGVYTYLAVYEWDYDLPGQVVVAKMDYLKRSVKKFYDNGARAYLGESTMGWVSRGPGQYILSKLLWNINANIDSIRSEFFKYAYENVAPQMSKLYSLWENYPHGVVQDNDLADWLALINDAYAKASSKKIQDRLDYVKLYMNYVVMYRDVKTKPTEENMLKILNYSYRTFEDAAFATLPTMVSLPTYMGYQKWGWYGTEQPWKNDKRPYTKAEMDQAIRQTTMATRKIEGIGSFAKTNDLVMLRDIMTIPSRKFAQAKHSAWDLTEYVFRINSKSENNFVELTNGFSAQPPIDKDVEVNIYPITAGTPNSDTRPELAIRQGKYNVTEKFSLGSLKPGTYRAIINDHRKAYLIKFSEPIDYSIVMNADTKLKTTSSAGLNYFYFYVPKGTKRFMVTKTAVIQLISPKNRIVDKQNNLEETFAVDVQPGEEGLWIIDKQAGTLYIEGVPPYLGDLPSRMLVPAYLKK